MASLKNIGCWRCLQLVIKIGLKSKLCNWFPSNVSETMESLRHNPIFEIQAKWLKNCVPFVNSTPVSYDGWFSRFSTSSEAVVDLFCRNSPPINLRERNIVQRHGEFKLSGSIIAIINTFITISNIVTVKLSLSSLSLSSSSLLSLLVLLLLLLLYSSCDSSCHS